MGEAQERLARLAARWDLALSATQADRLLAYGQLLIDWNQRINLTGARSLLHLIDDHFSDAFAVSRQLTGEPAVLDVGSGGGLPAIPAAVLAEGASFVLVEPIRKKVAFLRTAIRALDLGARLSVVADRIENAGVVTTKGFDVAVSCAAFEPAIWLSKAVALVRSGGKILALTGTPVETLPPGLIQIESVRYGVTPPRWLLVLLRST